MQKNSNQSISDQRIFPPIQEITRQNITTEEAAYYLNRRPQTLRCWAMREDGLIRPIRINGRLAWSVAEIKALLNGGN